MILFNDLVVVVIVILLIFVTGSFKMIDLTVRLQTVGLKDRKPISRKYIVL